MKEMNSKKWVIENRVYLEAETYEQAVSKFYAAKGRFGGSKQIDLDIGAVNG